jgi:hypothetical protein
MHPKKPTPPPAHAATSPLEGSRSEMRVLVARVEAEVSRIATPLGNGNDPGTDLATAWHALVDLLALGPEPETRACPMCGAIGMRAATLCGSCWSKLTPPDDGSGA